MDDSESYRLHGKDLQDFVDSPRQPAAAYLRKQSLPAAPRVSPAAPPPGRFQALKAFLSRNVWAWAGQYLRYRIGPKHPFAVYTDSRHDNGVYPLEGDAGEVRLALAGDWGTGTDEAFAVGERIKEFDPHYTVHLGDVYFVGDPDEVKENFLGIADPRHAYRPCRWPGGSRGSFALNGNHEMYARGYGYFDLMLPELGLKHAGKAQGQKASFFCLQNEHWRIIGLDTGYRSINIPVIENIPPFRPDCALPDPLVDWLRETVFTSDDRRGVVLLSHHQYCSRFDVSYTRQAEQLAAFIAHPVLWFWGHEHRLVIYEQYSRPGGIAAYGRCIGHAGMPVELPPPAVKDPCCVAEFLDLRSYQNDEDLDVGYNGFVRLTLRAAALTAEYADLNGAVTFRETWTIDPSGVLVRTDAAAFQGQA